MKTFSEKKILFNIFLKGGKGEVCIPHEALDYFHGRLWSNLQMGVTPNRDKVQCSVKKDHRASWKEDGGLRMRGVWGGGVRLEAPGIFPPTGLPLLNSLRQLSKKLSKA